MRSEFESIEILDAKKRISQPTQVIYQLEERGAASR